MDKIKLKYYPVLRVHFFVFENKKHKYHFGAKIKFLGRFRIVAKFQV